MHAAVHQQAVHLEHEPFTHLYACACTRTWPSRQLGQLTALARSRVFTQSHLFLHCLHSLGNTQFAHSSTVMVNTHTYSPRLHLLFSLIPPPLWVLFFQTASLSSLEAFEPVIQQLPPFLLYLFNHVVLILYWMMLR